MSKQVNFAVIGCSGMAKRHMQGVIAKEGAHLYAICDPATDGRMEKCKEEFNVPVAVTDYRELVNDPNIDAVALVVPDNLHLEMAAAFMRAGKDVFCEKPMALTMEECEEMRRVEKETGRKLMIGQVCRFAPAFVMAKELVASGRIGELFFVESEYAHDYGRVPGYNNWRVTPEREGFIGGGCHAVDLLRWIVGDPIEVFAYGSHKLLPQVSYDDATIAVMKFNDGIIGKVFVSTGCKRPYTMRTLFYGTKGTIICDNKSDTMQLYTLLPNDISVNPEPEIIPVIVNNHNTVREFEVFAEHILNDTPVEMDARLGAKTIAACLAIVESANTGKPVVPNYEF